MMTTRFFVHRSANVLHTGYTHLSRPGRSVLLALSMTVFALCTAADPGRASGVSERPESIETRVVRVHCVRKSPYYHNPWKSPDFRTIRSSGFFFRDEDNFPGERGLILTNAHGVSMAEAIRVSNGREKRQYKAKSLGVLAMADFAVLQLEPQELEAYEKRNGPIKPLEFGDSDKLRVGDRVLGWGYPLGGDRISKSEEGEINRIEVGRYAYSRELWLMVQASLQQNRGNSGGPVFKGRNVVGISFQGITQSDRINYFIPINLIKHLMPVLQEPDKIPRWRYVVQHMFPQVKQYYDRQPDDPGVLLNYVVPDGGPYSFGLRSNDILVSIDGHEIDNFGEIFFKPLEQNIYFGEVLNRKKVGDTLTVEVVRDGELKKITGPVTPGLPRLVPRIFTTANYFIFSGIGFVELTENCIKNLGKSGERYRERYYHDLPDRPYRKIVIVAEVFPEYGLVKSDSYLRRVEKIDEEEILNLKHLYEEIMKRKEAGASKAMLTVRGDLRLPLDMDGADKMDEEIRTRYGILYMKTPGGIRR